MKKSRKIDLFQTMLIFNFEHIEWSWRDYFYIWKKRKIKLIVLCFTYILIVVFSCIFFINYVQNKISLIFWEKNIKIKIRPFKVRLSKTLHSQRVRRIKRKMYNSIELVWNIEDDVLLICTSVSRNAIALLLFSKSGSNTKYRNNMFSSLKISGFIL